MGNPSPGTPLPYPLAPAVATASQGALQPALDSTLHEMLDLLLELKQQMPVLTPDGRMPVSGGDQYPPAITGFSLELTQKDLLQKLTDILNRLASTLQVSTGLQQPTRPSDTQPISAVSLPLPAGAATQVTALDTLGKLGELKAALLDIYGAVDGLELTAGNISINASAINLNTDEVESRLAQIRDRLPSVIGQLTRASSLAVTLSAEDASALVALIDAVTALPRAQAATNAQLRETPLPISGGVTTDDSSEREYAPGLVSDVASQAGDKEIYAPPAGKAWRLRWAYAVPVTRGSEDAPVITIKTVNAAGGALKTHYSAAAVSKRKVITMPADARLVVSLDIAGRVPVTFDIEELP